MGSGKSSGSSAPVVTQEQKDQLTAQTGLLTNTLIPAYQKTIAGASDFLGQTVPYMQQAATQNYDLTGNVARQGVQGGGAMMTQGAGELGKLFDPNYEQGQINAALQAGRESARESQAGQNAMYGAAGGLGSARMALADQNLESLNAQRQATAAANAQAQVQQNRSAAANSMLAGGNTLMNTGLSAAGQQIGMANAPMDLYSKYASIMYGTPGSAGGNYAGTQGQNTSGSSKGFKI